MSQGAGLSALQREGRRIQACTPHEAAVQVWHRKRSGSPNAESICWTELIHSLTEMRRWRIFQALHFKEHLAGVKDYSACGAGSWMRKYHQLAPKGPKARQFQCIGFHARSIEPPRASRGEGLPSM